MKKAFTLAEVLLTLAIIGVIAALTIPAVITKAAKDQYVTGLKKAYNTLKQVEREAIREYGETAYWQFNNSGATSTPEFTKYFKPHFDILKDCGLSTDGGCFAQDYKYLDPSKGNAGSPLNNLHKIVTADGIAYAFWFNGTDSPLSHKVRFYVDVNGHKPPNTFGKDFFVFYLYPKYGVKPAGAMVDDADSNPVFATSAQMNTNCSPTSTGMLCAGKVLAEGAMNY